MAASKIQNQYLPHSTVNHHQSDHQSKCIDFESTCPLNEARTRYLATCTNRVDRKKISADTITPSYIPANSKVPCSNSNKVQEVCLQRKKIRYDITPPLRSQDTFCPISFALVLSIPSSQHALVLQDTLIRTCASSTNSGSQHSSYVPTYSTCSRQICPFSH